MIYRIHHDENYLMHLVHPVESMRKLGEKYGVFAFNAEPKPYASVWTPLQIEFHASEGKKSKAMPDVSEHFGRLFLSERACQALKVLTRNVRRTASRHAQERNRLHLQPINHCRAAWRH
ncbi:MAG: hypothetical protein R3F38_06790 [Gammaproteobacteria bacterium]